MFARAMLCSPHESRLPIIPRARAYSICRLERPCGVPESSRFCREKRPCFGQQPPFAGVESPGRQLIDVAPPMPADLLAVRFGIGVASEPDEPVQVAP